MLRLRKFWSLTQREQLLFCEACIALLLSNLSVKILAFRYIERLLRAHWNSQPQNAHDANDIKQTINLIDRSLSRAANSLPWKSLCLSRSIAVFAMLRRRHIPAVLFAGVRLLEDSSLSAHAWVQTEREVMDEKSENAVFTVLMRIEGERPILLRAGTPSD